MRSLKIQPFFGIIPLLSMLIITNCEALAFQKEPNSFRGITWGAGIKDLPDMVLKEDVENKKYYIRKTDNLKIGDAELDTVYYVFYKGRFSSVMIEFHSPSNAAVLRETLFREHGPGYRPDTVKETYVWTGTKVSIVFVYNGILKQGELSYFFLPMFNEEELDKEDGVQKTGANS